MTETQFLEVYRQRLEKFVDSCIQEMESARHSKVDLVSLSNDCKSTITKRATDLIGEIMREENLIASCPVLQDDMLVPLETHLKKQSLPIENALLAKLDNYSRQVLGASQKD